MRTETARFARSQTLNTQRLRQPANPQSLNRYAYVLNNPATYVDPFGLECSAAAQALAASEGSICIDTMGSAPMPGGPPPTSGSGGGGSISGAGWSSGHPAHAPVQDVGATRGPGARSQSWLAGTVRKAVEQGQQIETLSNGLNTLSTPFQNYFVGGALIATGSAITVVSIASVPVVCAETGGLGCVSYATFLAGPSAAGGLTLIYTGYKYTKEVTVPSFVDLWNAFKRH